MFVYIQYLALRNELPDHQRLILVIGYHLGMRRGEILNSGGIRWTGRKISSALERKQTKGKAGSCRAPYTGNSTRGSTWLPRAKKRTARLSSRGAANKSAR